MSSAIGQLIATEGLPPEYARIATEFWRPLSEEIALRAIGAPIIVGINGAQGSGKTTLCRFLEVLLVEHNQRTATLSLDDLYLTHAQRQVLARDHHPLFATRGVPGTHDVDLGMDLLDRLLDGRPADLPRFDKASDDRANDTIHIEGPINVILLEGWCVGATPQPAAALARPVNELERTEDPDGVWRREVNRRLATDYAELFGRIDLLVMLEIAGFESVRANRLRQEEKLGHGPAVMDEAALERFIAHYERLTRHMLAEMPARADIVVEIGPDQRPLGVRPALFTSDQP